MQGKGSDPAASTLYHPTIPANAGKRKSRLKEWLNKDDNPRKCREKLANPHLARLNQSTIPANAGKRGQTQLKSALGCDNPRKCREKQDCVAAPNGGGRQSPQMQGKVYPPVERGGLYATIPANAGKRVQFSSNSGVLSPKESYHSPHWLTIPYPAFSSPPFPALLFFIFSSNTPSYSPCLTLTLSDWAMLLA